jgi:hypothetical protein
MYFAPLLISVPPVYSGKYFSSGTYEEGQIDSSNSLEEGSPLAVSVGKRRFYSGKE